MRKTKIVATLGPATESREMIEKFIILGVNVFRLNFSHGDHESHRTLIRHIRAIAGRLDMPVAILQDIAGPKIRVGTIAGIMPLETGDRLTIYPDRTKGGELEITISHPEILRTLAPGAAIYFADGAIRAEVRARVGEAVVVEILVGGKLTSRKGVNVPLADLQRHVRAGGVLQCVVFDERFLQLAVVVNLNFIIDQIRGHGHVIPKAFLIGVLRAGHIGAVNTV